MPELDAVLYAKDLAAMSRFYAAVLGRPPVHTDATIAVVSATDSAFIPSVVASVAAWRFAPAEEGPVNRPRKPVEMRIALPVTVAPSPRR